MDACLLFVVCSFFLSHRASLNSFPNPMLSFEAFLHFNRSTNYRCRQSNAERRNPAEQKQRKRKEKRTEREKLRGHRFVVVLFVCLSEAIIRLERDLFYPLAARQYISFCSALSKHSRTRITARTSDRTEEKTEIRSNARYRLLSLVIVPKHIFSASDISWADVLPPPAAAAVVLLIE